MFKSVLISPKIQNIKLKMALTILEQKKKVEDGISI